MSENSKIEWTDSTFNPWEGCTKVGPGCDHCYAEARNNRFQGGNWGPGAPRRRTSEANWRKPLAWSSKPFYECADCGWRGDEKGTDETFMRCKCGGILRQARRRVFCASLADWLDNEVPIEWLADLLDLIRQTPNLDWLMLTKRIGNWTGRLEAAYAHVCENTAQYEEELASWVVDWRTNIPPANVWLGATIVNQEEADRDIPKLLSIPARVRFLSMEPLLGPVDLSSSLTVLDRHRAGLADDPLAAFMLQEGMDSGHAFAPISIHWVIAGGESGPQARPSHPEWFRSLRDQCQAAGVPFLFKQWGKWAPYDRGLTDSERLASPGSTDKPSQKFGKKRAGRLLDGRTWDQFPEAS